MNINIRPIQQSDNPSLAKIVRNTLAEFGANHKGTVYWEPTTDTLFELFQTEGAAYFVAEIDGNIVGGGGIYPTAGLPDGVCELVKMYLAPEGRGVGLGRTLIEKSLAHAKDFGYKKVYLESMPELKKALGIYEKFGFQYLDKQIGGSGHFGCQIWMIKDIA